MLSISNFDNFLMELDIPSIDQVIANDLERPLCIAELTKAVKSLQGGKCP